MQWAARKFLLTWSLLHAIIELTQSWSNAVFCSTQLFLGWQYPMLLAPPSVKCRNFFSVAFCHVLLSTYVPLARLLSFCTRIRENGGAVARSLPNFLYIQNNQNKAKINTVLNNPSVLEAAIECARVCENNKLKKRKSYNLLGYPKENIHITKFS